MSGPVSMPSMQPNMPPPHMAPNIPPLMQGPNMPPISPNMHPPPPPPPHNLSASPPISMPNVSQSMQGMPLVHTSQAEQMHPYHRGEVPLERNGDPRMLGAGPPPPGGGGVGGGGDSGMGVPEPMPPPPPKKDNGPKEKV